MPDHGGKGPAELALSNLLLDKDNPRFGFQDKAAVSQTLILDKIVEKFGVDDVLSSLAVNGYFDAEPLVARKIEGSDNATVVEGNRRLAACLILTADERAKSQITRTQEYRPIWEAHGKKSIDPVPVILFDPKEQEKEIYSYLGVRHISSAQPWDSYAKAAWVARVVEDTGISVDERVSGAMDDFDPQDSTIELDWHRRDVELDTAVGKTREELERRQGVLADAYPFLLDQNKLGYRGSTTLFYEFCLAICNAPNITEGAFVGLPRTFERISALLISKYLGPDTDVLHTGWPRDTEVGVRFRAAMTKLHERSSEWHWKPDEDLPDDPDPEQTKDEGLDFVVWKSSTDRRCGQLFLAAQCACGDNWKEKLKDLDFTQLRKWFNPMTLVDPVRLFVTPHHVTDALLTDAQRSAGIIFDRLRLAHLAQRHSADPEVVKWKPEMERLIGLVQGA